MLIVRTLSAGRRGLGGRVGRQGPGTTLRTATLAMAWCVMVSSFSRRTIDELPTHFQFGESWASVSHEDGDDDFEKDDLVALLLMKLISVLQ